MSVWAILVAAGRGERLGLDQPKAFAKLGEDPLLAEPLRRLEESDWIDAIVLVAPPGGRSRRSCSPRSSAAARSARASRAARRAPTRCGPAGGGAGRRGRRARARRGAAARPEAVIERVLAPLSEGWDGAVPGPAGRRHAQARRRRRRDRGDGLARRALGRADAAGVSRRRAARARSRPAATPPTAPRSSRRAAAASRSCEGDPQLLKVTTADDLAKIAAWL